MKRKGRMAHLVVLVSFCLLMVVSIGCQKRVETTEEQLSTVDQEKIVRERENWYRTSIQNLESKIDGDKRFQSLLGVAKTKNLKFAADTRAKIDSRKLEIDRLSDEIKQLKGELIHLKHERAGIDIMNRKVAGDKGLSQDVLKKLKDDFKARTDTPSIIADGRTIFEVGTPELKGWEESFDASVEYFKDKFPEIEIDFSVSQQVDETEVAEESEGASVPADDIEDADKAFASVVNNEIAADSDQPTFAVFNGLKDRKSSSMASEIRDFLRKNDIHVNRVKNSSETYWQSALYLKDMNSEKVQKFARKIKEALKIDKMALYKPFAGQIESVVLVIGHDIVKK